MDAFIPQFFGLVFVLAVVFGLIYLILSFARPEQASKLAEIVKAIIFALLRRDNGNEAKPKKKRQPLDDDEPLA